MSGMATWLRRRACRFYGHRYVGSQACPYLNGGVPTHCARCDWTQGPWESPDLARGLNRTESRTKGERRLIRRMEKYGGKGFRILRSAEATRKRYRPPLPTPCPVCGGAGIVDTSPPGVEHAPWLQTDTDCPRCDGTGEIDPTTYEPDIEES